MNQPGSGGAMADGGAHRGAVVARDGAADLAVLKRPAGAPFAAFRQGRGIRPGTRVVVAGYPLRGLLAPGLSVGTGIALRDPVRRALAVRGARKTLDLERHQTLDREPDHLAKQVRVETLVQQRPQAHHVGGGRRGAPYRSGGLFSPTSKPAPRRPVLWEADSPPPDSSPVAAPGQLPTATIGSLGSCTTHGDTVVFAPAACSVTLHPGRSASRSYSPYARNESMDGTDGLERLEASLARDFERLNHPPPAWVPSHTGPDGRRMVDVAIVGAGMCGLAAAFALRRLGVSNLRQIDRRPEGREGPWLTYARMNTLRSPKHLTGPVLGLAGLTFRAWWEAQGNDWEALGRIPRGVWMHYLAWYRGVTGARVENEVEVAALEPGREGVRVRLTAPVGVETIHARHVVLASGREGQASPRVPEPLAPFLGNLVRHSSEDIDFAALAGRRVAVVGLAATAFDNAAAALEAGAFEVVLIGRASALPRINKMKQTVYPGFTHGFPELPDREKLRWLDHVAQNRIAPPRDSVLRISSHPRLRLTLGAEITGAMRDDAALMLETTKGEVVADRVILGTGFAFDLGAPRETAALAPEILRWRDRVPDAAGEWGECPYLAPDFAFLPRTGSRVEGLGRLHCFTHAAQLSLGNLANDIPVVSEGAERLAKAIAASLFVEDRDHHWGNLQGYADPELLGDEWPGLDAWDPPVAREES